MENNIKELKEIVGMGDGEEGLARGGRWGVERVERGEGVKVGVG